MSKEQRMSVVVLGLLAGCIGCGPHRRAGEERTNEKDGALMVWVPGTREVCQGGTFEMGSTVEETEALWARSGWRTDRQDLTRAEKPAHAVRLTGFWVYKYEVTVGEYAAFLRATERRQPPELERPNADPTHPVNSIDWRGAEAYAKWAGGALPTEAQWEYVARGPERRAFPWGNEWARERCNSSELWAGKAFPDDSSRRAWSAELSGDPSQILFVLQPVGQSPADASWCGAVDLAGNATEWCRDLYDEEFYSTEAATGCDPVCATDEGVGRATRGGSCADTAWMCRSACRTHAEAGRRSPVLGFRVVVPEEPTTAE